MKNLLKILIAIFILSGCDGDSNIVRFKTSQPDGSKSLSFFSNKLKGVYVNCDNPNDEIVINDNQIINTITYKFKIHKDDLNFDSTNTIDIQNNDELINFFEKDGFNIQIVSDTIFAVAIDIGIDTIFKLSNNNHILKKYKGSYFLNFKKDENNWAVKRIDIKKDYLFISQIPATDSLLKFDFVAKFEEVNDIENTTKTEYLITSNKKEFKKLIKSNSFEQTECYKKK